MLPESELEELLIRHVRGCHALVKAERLSGGASQETYRLTIDTAEGTKQLAFRRAPRGEDTEPTAEHPGLAAEAALLRLANSADVPTPVVHHVVGSDPGPASDAVGPGIVMEWLEGETLGARIVRSPELAEIRPKLAFECGQVLSRIHDLELTPALTESLSVVSAKESVMQSWDIHRAFNTSQPMIDFTARWLLDNLPEPAPGKLVHNDFRNGNLMIDPSGIVAVLDWELAHIGDPMRDLGWLCVNSWRFGQIDNPVGGFGAREDLYAGYEAATGEPVDAERVKFWEVFGSFWWAVHSLAMAESYRMDPAAGVERPGIARRSSECQIDCVNMIIPGPVTAPGELTTAPPAASLLLLEGQPVGAPSELPQIGELLQSVESFLKDEVKTTTTGRTSFLARVAANSLAIVRRDLDLGPAARADELARLETLVSSGGTSVSESSLVNLRHALCVGLQTGEIPLDTDGLASHLRQSVVDQVAIDQPSYTGLSAVLAV